MVLMSDRLAASCSALGSHKHWTLGTITAAGGADKQAWLNVGYLFQKFHSLFI